MAQTTVQNEKALLPWSGVIYIGEDWSSLVNIGAFRDLVYNHKSETTSLVFDNVDEIKRIKNNRKVSFEFKLAEVEPNLWRLFNKGLVNVEYVAWTTQTVTDESVVMADNKVNLLANRNGDGTRVANITVKSSNGATTYTEGTDYEVVVNENGYTGLVIVQGGGISDGDTVLVSYDYTPITMKRITFVDSWVAQWVVVRFVHTDNEGKKIEIDLENVSNIKTLGIDFVGDNDDDVAVMDIELEGYLVEYRDEITV